MAVCVYGDVVRKSANSKLPTVCKQGNEGTEIEERTVGVSTVFVVSRRFACSSSAVPARLNVGSGVVAEEGDAAIKLYASGAASAASLLHQKLEGGCERGRERVPVESRQWFGWLVRVYAFFMPNIPNRQLSDFVIKSHINVMPGGGGSTVKFPGA